jgi:hypothetical protein
MAGKLDYYSFHIIIVKDNYKDIPNMIRLAKECHVDRVLIQPFLKGDDQGYKNYEDAAIHLPQHPEYHDFVKILDQYKDEPILYTYLNLPGYDTKISKDVDVQKAYVIYLKSDEAFMANNLEESLTLLLESIELNPREYAYQRLAEIYKKLGKDSEAAVAMEKYKELVHV